MAGEWSRPLTQLHHCASMRMPLGLILVRQPRAYPPDDPSALKMATPVARALPCRKVAGQEKMGPAGAVVGLGCSMQFGRHAKAFFQTGCRCLAPCAAVSSPRYPQEHGRPLEASWPLLGARGRPWSSRHPGASCRARSCASTLSREEGFGMSRQAAQPGGDEREGAAANQQQCCARHGLVLRSAACELPAHSKRRR